jgi:hypothetical protein
VGRAVGFGVGLGVGLGVGFGVAVVDPHLSANRTVHILRPSAPL